MAVQCSDTRDVYPQYQALSIYALAAAGHSFPLRRGHAKDPEQSSRLIIPRERPTTSASVDEEFPPKPKTRTPAGMASKGREIGRSLEEGTSAFSTGVAVTLRRERAGRKKRIWMSLMIVGLEWL